MDEFEEFRIRSFRPQTEEEDEDRMSHGRNRCHLMSDQSHGCTMDVTEIFPSPVDIYEVRKAWYGDQSTVSENVADDVGELGAIDGGPGVPRQGHRSCRTEPEDNAQRTPFNTLSRSCRTDSRERLQRRTSSTEKVTGPFRTVAVVDGTTHASSGDTPTSKLAPVASLSTSLSSSSSSSSSPATGDGHPTSKVTDGPTIQLEQAVYRVRSFSTDNGNVLNLGDSFKVFNRLLLLTSADDNSNGVEQPPVHQTPPRESNTAAVHAEESGSTVPAIAKRSGSSMRSPTRTAYKTTSRNTLHRFCTSVDFLDSDRSELSDADTGDANDERKELLKHDDNRNSSEEDEEEAEEGYELLRRIAFPAIPSPEDAKKRSSSSGAAIALRSLGGEDDGCSGALLNPGEEGASVPREEGDEVVGHWAGDSLLRVRLIGSHGVGKTTLTQQLMTSEYRPTDLVTSSEKCCSCPLDNVVVVQVDDVQSVIQFIDISSGEVADPCGIGSGGGVAEVDVFLVVYSVTDRPSFKYAGALLRQLSRRFPPSRSSATPQPVAILVANKQDLVRKRVVSENSGKRLALKRRCKFIEISAFLDHRVDELLVGILKQLQLQQLRLCVLEDGEEDEEDDDFKSGTDAGCLRTVGFLRFWRRLSWQYCSHAYQPSSCDDLFV